MKKTITLLTLLCVFILQFKGQNCCFQYQGKTIENDATITIEAVSTWFGDLECTTNPSADPGSGLAFVNMGSTAVNCSATISIINKTMTTESIQWSMGAVCEIINGTTKTKYFSASAGSSTLVEYNCIVTKDGEMLTKLEVKADGSTYSVNIIFTTSSSSPIISISNDTFIYTGRSPQISFEVRDGYEAFLDPSFTLEKNAGTYSTHVPFTIKHNNDIYQDEIYYRYTILPKKIHAKVNDACRLYGEENPQFETSYSGFVDGEDMSEIVNSGIYLTNATNSSDVGKYIVKQSGAEAPNYSFEYEDGILEIKKAALQISVKNVKRQYGENNPSFDMLYTGLVCGENVPEWTQKPSFITDATQKSDIGEYDVIATGGVLKNYDFGGIAPGKITITPAQLLITADDASMLYCSTIPNLTYKCTGFVGSDDEEVLSKMPKMQTNATQISPVGTYPIEVSGAEAKNYTISYENGTLDILKRRLTVSTKDYTRAYGEENPEFEISYNGFVNNEDERVLRSKPLASTTATKRSDVGSYKISVGDGEAQNYEFSYIDGVLTIEKAYQTLSWEQDFSDAKQYDQLELMAEASSGLAVTYSIEGDNIGSITKIGTKQYLDCSGAGEAIIVAQQEGDKNYWQTTKMYKPIKIVPTAVQDLENQANHVESIYDASGRKLSKLQRGVNVVVMSDGTKKKVVVK